MKKILITTTDTLHGWEIEAYLKPIFASVVLGTNAFADFSASFSDFFGGRSSSYEKRLQLIKDNAIAILTNKASELGANCVLGLKVDVDQISGKNMQMFMITAGGTAVIAHSTKSQVDIRNLKELDKEIVKEQAMIMRLAKKYEQVDTPLNQDDLRPIIDSHASVFKDYILARLKLATSSSITDDVSAKLYQEYFSKIEPKDAISVLYPPLFSDISDGFAKYIVSIIKDNDLVDYSQLYRLLDHEKLAKRKIALNLLLAFKTVYSYGDIGELKAMIEHVERSFPIQSIPATRKGFLSSTEKEAWTCFCGRTNAVDVKHCNGCYNDQYGFQSSELKPSGVIELLRFRLSALESLLA